MTGENKDKGLITADTWSNLQHHTPARIALGRTGISLPTRQVLEFSRAHALARDAVQAGLDVDLLTGQLEELALPIIAVRSQAPNRAAYLARPDWGRRLHAEATLPDNQQNKDLLFVLADGLSATAVHRHAQPLLNALLPLLEAHTIAPLVVAEQARVALADDIGEQMKARLSVILIGERPGLSAPDSLGAYITYSPKVGNTDAQRNCISNIRPEGLSYQLAAEQIAGIVKAAFRLQGTGVGFSSQ